MAHDVKTEQATPRRRQKAREKGQVARSRELSSALALCGGLVLLAWTAGTAVAGWRQFLRSALDSAAVGSMPTPLLTRAAESVLKIVLLPLAGAWVLATAGAVAQGGLIFAPAALAPSLERMSPAGRLRQLFSITGFSQLLKSLLPFSAILYCCAAVLMRDWSQLCGAGVMSAADFFDFLSIRVIEIGWKSALVFLGWAAVDYWLVRRKHEAELRMSREEVREEFKETEGHPTIKMRIRRLQQQVRRRRMMQDVARAAVVVTNPTHYAVALEYQSDMDAPKVLAKGRNLLAQQIKDAARWHSIPVLENPPLAQALYHGVEVGQAIPAKLYAAVAELLAFVYRAQQRASGGIG